MVEMLTSPGHHGSAPGGSVRSVLSSAIIQNTVPSQEDGLQRLTLTCGRAGGALAVVARIAPEPSGCFRKLL